MKSPNISKINYSMYDRVCSHLEGVGQVHKPARQFYSQQVSEKIQSQYPEINFAMTMSQTVFNIIFVQYTSTNTSN